MLSIICTTDPISGTELRDLTDRPMIVDEDAENRLTVYFESEANRQAWLAIPIEHPISELSVNLDNPVDEGIDEG